MRHIALLVGLVLLAGLTFVFSDPAALAQAPEGWGDVKGQIVWGGNGLPAIKNLKVDKDQTHCLSKGDIPSEEWVINKDNKGIRYAVVWLIPDPVNGKLAVHPSLQAVPKKEVEIDQPCCKFEPHVVAIRQGQTIVAKNSAPIAHNFKWAGIGNRGDNKLMPPGSAIKIDDLKASRFPVAIECNIHPWMKGWARVFDHPYFAVTDENGNFTIKQAPAGKCRFVVWHEGGGFRKDKDGEPLEIKAGAATDLGKLDLKPRD